MADNAAVSIDDVAQISRRAGVFAIVSDRLLARVLSSPGLRRLDGLLQLRLPSGRSISIGRPGTSDAALEIVSYGAISAVIRRGLVGFAESYIAGDVRTPDLPALLSYFLRNELRLVEEFPALLKSSRKDRHYHASRRNSKAGSRRNIAAHYDLGNAFYRHWLDAGLSYSSAIYRSPDWSLEQAQAEKHRAILDALELSPGQHLIEIGCGWGSLIEIAARAGADVTGITISSEQFAECTGRIARTGLTDRARVLFKDYRDMDGAFDRLASIEMIEAVGEDHWPTYFSVLANVLNPGGLGVLQAITIREDLYDEYRARPDFIQRYIFPGGMLPTVGLMRVNAEGAGFEFDVIEQFGQSYAETLAEWRRRFHAAWPKIAPLGFDDRFRRMWDYYLCYCEAGFRYGLIDVGLYRLRKPAVSSSSAA